MRDESLLIAPCELWDREPNMLLWEDPTTRLACLALRNTPDGDEREYLCGYVCVPEGRPAFKAPWDDGLIRCPPVRSPRQTVLGIRPGMKLPAGANACGGDRPS